MKLIRHYLRINNALIFAPLLALTLLSGCNGDPHDQHEQLSGKQLFKLHCAGCHNETGLGNFLLGVPGNKGTPLSENEIIQLIRGKWHKQKPDMPSMPDMSAAEAAKIAAYLKQL